MTENININYRQGTMEDNETVLEIFVRAIIDLEIRHGMRAEVGPPSREEITRMQGFFRAIFEHVSLTAEHFWLAERDGMTIGYARSIFRDGMRELTDFFVLPGEQSAGVGKQLMELTFPAEGAHQRAIIATIDLPALVTYMKSQVYPQFPIYYFGRKPEEVQIYFDLEFQEASSDQETLEAMAALDITILGHRRDVDHKWLLGDRNGFVYLRQGVVVGYGYVGPGGPFALQDVDDFPAVIAHAETYAAQLGHERFGVQVPMVNHTAVDYLLKRGYLMDQFVAYWMSDKIAGKFENYLMTTPVFFV